MSTRTETATPYAVTKEVFVRTVASLLNMDVSSLYRGRCNPVTFYRWLKNQKRSAPLDRHVAQRLGLRAELLRRMAQ